MSDVMLRVENLGKKYMIYYQPEGQFNYGLLRDVSFEVKRGECVGIIGRNEAAKSTLPI